VSKFNRLGVAARGAISAVVAENTPSTTTYEGGPGHTRDVKSELFQLAVVNMVGEQSFYEDAQSRDTRYAQLVRQATLDDADWTARMLKWLRSTANMRSASLVGAAEYTRARLDAGLAGTSRGVVDSVLQRADEPDEMLAYWTSRYGKAIPKPIKRGVADAATRLYTEYSLLKYDTASNGFRFADVIDLTHPTPTADWQHALFKHALDRRHGRDDVQNISANLPMIYNNITLRSFVAEGDFARLLDPDTLRQAGMTWEDVLSLAGSKVGKAKLWEALIPSMGYMALLRNLRNFDEAGVSDLVATSVGAKLMHPDEVARSRQFPYRFLSAYESAQASLRWNVPLSTALDRSLANIPMLPGRTLVLVDTSGSMSTVGLSTRSKMTPVKAAALLGVALTRRNMPPQGTSHVDLFGFATGEFRHIIQPGAATLHEVNRFVGRVGEVGHGTDMWGALRRTYDKHDRVFLITDMQTVTDRYAVGQAGSLPVPTSVPIYGFNLAGYNTVAYAAGSPNRHEFGGLNDATLRAIPLLEASRDAGWPF
jgi:hypothetical protein